MATSTIDKLTAKLSNSNLDPYENSALRYYLEFGRHEPGTSSKTCAAVKRQALGYRFDLDYIYHLEDNGDECKVPKRSERTELIDKAHRLGHFQAKSVFDSLRVEYFWPKMFKDIEHFVARCKTCQLHQKAKSLNHPARSILVSKFNDVVHIDLVQGLDETDGYVGMFVAYERLTHYPVAIPIRSKSMDEIARVLFENYIRLFGPPRMIVSDKGTEFVNGVVGALLKLHGNDHVVTSAYNPRANGIVERFNQTLCECLRKVANENPTKWYLHIPFALYSYRKRVNTQTGETPLSLLTGVQSNKFINYKDQPKAEDSLALEARRNEIGQLVDYTRPIVTRRLTEKAEETRRAQDAAQNIVLDSLEPGTMVLLKKEGILNKL